MSDLFTGVDVGFLNHQRPRRPPGRRAAAQAWHWPRETLPSEWMEQNLFLPPTVSYVPGRFSFESRPWWKTFVDWTIEPGRQILLAIASSQSGKSATCTGLTGWGADTRPGRILWLRETGPKVEEFLSDTLIPIYTHSPKLANILRKNGREAIRKSGLRFDSGGSLVTDTVGGKSALVSRSPWMVVLDELDKCYENNRGLGDLLGAATKRILTHRTLGRAFGISTPTFDDKGIWEQWLKSQQWEWNLPCPTCGVNESLSFFGRTEDGQAINDLTGIDSSLLKGGIRWDRLADGSHPDPGRLLEARSAWYECPHCGHRTSENEKALFVRSGALECMTPERASYQTAMHISGMLSPDYTWSLIAKQFLSALHRPSEMVTFRNETLALPQTTRSEKIVLVSELDDLKKSSNYMQGTDGVLSIPPIPKGVERLYFAADAQKVEFWGVLEGVGYEGESWTLWTGRIDSKEDIRQIDTAIWKREDGALLSLARGGIDTSDGNRTHELYHLISTMSNFVSLKGNRNLSKPLIWSNQNFKLPDGSVSDMEIKLYSWFTTHFQDVLQNQISRGYGTGAGG